MLKRYEFANHPRFPDHRAETFRAGCRERGVTEAANWQMRFVDIIWIETEQTAQWDEAMSAILLDPVLHEATLHPKLRGVALERRLMPGMTDNRARTLLEALQLQIPGLRPEEVKIRTGEMAVLENATELPFIHTVLRDLLKPWWMNPVIHEFQTHTSEDLTDLKRYEAHEVNGLFVSVRAGEAEDALMRTAVETFPVTELSDEALVKLSDERTLALSLSEMRAIRDHYRAFGHSSGRSSGRLMTDVELEVFAQTWSEHCQHKLFGATIDYRSSDSADSAREIPAQVNGLFRETIRRTTAETPKPWLLSVFSDNAGIVQFTPEDAVCLKVETHNSPSALDPFGGAITGIVGVNRDILGCGLGAKPIANMDVFCVAPRNTANPMPEKIIAPDVLLGGIRAGVESGGNQSGIPTVNGSVTFHASYLGKPLVFVGTLGAMPVKVGERPIEEKKVLPGDHIVMLGGRIGRDGIHGATFSSLVLTETVSGNVVQLGDPITQKRMTDLLIEARDLNLYRAITDNGAGGLSSSVGEMAKLTGGAHLDVGAAPVKVPGLRPYERVISESQERMTLAIGAETLSQFLALAKRRGVEATVVGEFNASGKLTIECFGKRVGELDLHFLHEGTPRLSLVAEWTGPGVKSGVSFHESPKVDSLKSLGEVLKKVLAHPNVASKEWMIRQYDHEVQARSVLKPLTTLGENSSPTDAAVIRISETAPVAAVLGHGLCPYLGEYDPYLMAQMAVDEALRNVLATGAEYSATDASRVLSLVDNFCWPDPARSPAVAAALVRTAYGMRKACLEFGLPLISGKDSMKNDFRSEKHGKKIEISVLPTLLMTALGRIPDLARTRSSEFKRAGDEVYLIGPGAASLCGSILEDLGLARGDEPPAPQYSLARSLFEFLGSDASGFLRSAHDCSEGGLLAAVAESCFARNLGVTFARQDPWTLTDAFGEGFHRFVVSCDAIDRPRLQLALMERGIPFEHFGTVTSSPHFQNGKESLAIAELRDAWEGRSE